MTNYNIAAILHVSVLIACIIDDVQYSALRACTVMPALCPSVQRGTSVGLLLKKLCRLYVPASIAD